jgi:hypothetical protein
MGWGASYWQCAGCQVNLACNLNCVSISNLQRTNGAVFSAIGNICEGCTADALAGCFSIVYPPSPYCVYVGLGCLCSSGTPMWGICTYAKGTGCNCVILADLAGQAKIGGYFCTTQGAQTATARIALLCAEYVGVEGIASSAGVFGCGGTSGVIGSKGLTWVCAIGFSGGVVGVSSANCGVFGYAVTNYSVYGKAAADSCIGLGTDGAMVVQPFGCTDATWTGFKAPALGAGCKTIWTLPAADGSAGQMICTDASGHLGWGTGFCGDIAGCTVICVCNGIIVSAS